MPAPPDALSPARDLAGRGVRLGTETIAATLGLLGEPHRGLPAVLVTGTNGKGSTAAMIASIAAHSGTRTGLFTSPSLQRETEQIRLSGTDASFSEISDQALEAALGRVVAAAERGCPGQITSFEALTAAALLWFAEERAELLVLEAGLGGGRDATNIIEARCAVLVSIGLDHTEHLGGDLASIAREKAGTFRTSRPAVVGWLDREAETAVRHVARTRGVDVRFAAERIHDLQVKPCGLGPQRIRLSTARATYDIALPLVGAHQAGNAALSVLAAEALDEQGVLSLDPATISRGLAGCRWPGRLESLPAGAGTLLVDAAHNATGAAALSDFLKALARPYALVFGAFHDKDAGGMLERLAPGAWRIGLVPMDDARSWDPAPFAARLGIAASVHSSVGDAIEDAIAASDTPDFLVVACGSLRIVAAARRFAKRRARTP